MVLQNDLLCSTIISERRSVATFFEHIRSIQPQPTIPFTPSRASFSSNLVERHHTQPLLRFCLTTRVHDCETHYLKSRKRACTDILDSNFVSSQEIQSQDAAHNVGKDTYLFGSSFASSQKIRVEDAAYSVGKDTNLIGSTFASHPVGRTSNSFIFFKSWRGQVRVCRIWQIFRSIRCSGGCHSRVISTEEKGRRNHEGHAWDTKLPCLCDLDGEGIEYRRNSARGHSQRQKFKDTAR